MVFILHKMKLSFNSILCLKHSELTHMLRAYIGGGGEFEELAPLLFMNLVRYYY